MNNKINTLIIVFAAALLVGSAPLAQAFYNPTTGRWLSRDPIEERGGQNVYQFVGNNAIERFDLLGQRYPEGYSFIDDAFWQPSLEGKPCCCNPGPAGIVSPYAPVDGGSDASAFRMKMQVPEVLGCWTDLRIRWRTCYRSGGVGCVASCNDKFECSFVSGGTDNSHVVGVYVRWLTCIKGRWTFMSREYGLYCRNDRGIFNGSHYICD